MSHVGDRVPALGFATEVRFDGGTTVLWWGPDRDGELDIVATRGGRLAQWPNVESARAHAASQGWHEADDATPAPDDEHLIDLEPAQAWLRGRSASPPLAAMLDLWNLATDVACSVAAPFDDRRRLSDACHAKLTAAAVPWLLGRERYTPHWSARELAELRRVLGLAVHVMRVALGSR